MPIYIYKTAAQGCGHCRVSFELVQSMKEDPLSVCPRCGQPVKRIPTTVSGGVPKLSNGNLRDLGFTKMKKRGDGTYEKLT